MYDETVPGTDSVGDRYRRPGGGHEAPDLREQARNTHRSDKRRFSGHVRACEMMRGHIFLVKVEHTTEK